MTNKRSAFFYGLVGIVMFGCGLFLFSLTKIPPPNPPAPTSNTAVNSPLLSMPSFANRASAVMFGFTHCPDFCPTGLAKMRRWISELGDKSKTVQFAFMTVDPERDTPETLARYVGSFSSEILPVSEMPENTKNILNTHGVYAKKVPLSSGGYTVDHHTAIFLFDRRGNFVEFVYHNDDEKTALKKLKRLIADNQAPLSEKFLRLISRAYLNLDARLFCA